MLPSSFLVVIVTITLSFGTTLASSSSSFLHHQQQEQEQNCVVYKGICQADWMANLPSQIRNTRQIRDLMFLSTHDTGAQLPLNFTATPYCEETDFFNIAKAFALDNITGPIITPIINNLTITQPSSVEMQMEQGVRGFDLRITWSNISQKLYLSHSFVAQPLEESLQGMQRFLSAHAGEMIVIQAEYDWEHQRETQPKTDEILRLFYKYLGQWLNPSCHDIHGLTLASVVESNKRVFLSFGETFDQNSHPAVCGGSLVNTYWPNGQNATQSIGRIQTYLKETNFSSTPKTFQLVFFTVTDDTKSIIADVLQDIFKTHHFVGLKDWSAQIRPLAWQVLDNFVLTQKRTGLAMISVDWPTDEYLQKIINWNLML